MNNMSYVVVVDDDDVVVHDDIAVHDLDHDDKGHQYLYFYMPLDDD